MVIEKMSKMWKVNECRTTVTEGTTTTDEVGLVKLMWANNMNTSGRCYIYLIHCCILENDIFMLRIKEKLKGILTLLSLIHTVQYLALHRIRQKLNPGLIMYCSTYQKAYLLLRSLNTNLWLYIFYVLFHL